MVFVFWDGKVTLAGLEDMDDPSWPASVRRVVCTQSAGTRTPGQAWAASAGLGLMAVPSTRKKSLAAGLPITVCGVTPSLMNPAGAAGAPDHCRKGSMGPVAAGLSVVELMSRPGAPSAVTLKA